MDRITRARRSGGRSGRRPATRPRGSKARRRTPSRRNPARPNTFWAASLKPSTSASMRCMSCPAMSRSTRSRTAAVASPRPCAAGSSISVRILGDSRAAIEVVPAHAADERAGVLDHQQFARGGFERAGQPGRRVERQGACDRRLLGQRDQEVEVSLRGASEHGPESYCIRFATSLITAGTPGAQRRTCASSSPLSPHSSSSPRRRPAHPLGNFSMNHLTEVSVSSERIDVTYVLDAAEIPTFQKNFDAKAEVARRLKVTVNGAPSPLRAETPTITYPPRAGGPEDDPRRAAAERPPSRTRAMSACRIRRSRAASAGRPSSPSPGAAPP